MSYKFKTQDKHLNSYIHSIIQLIKQSPTPVPFSTISSKLKINLYQNQPLLSFLKKNPKIIINRDTILFKPTFDIKTKEDLLDILKKEKNKGGIEMNELLDCPVDITGFIDHLKYENEVYVLTDLDNAQVCFYNELKIKKASDDIRELWMKIKVPDYQEVKNELSVAGHKSGNEDKKRRSIVENRKKIKKFKRSSKLTNTHIKELDFD